MKTKKTYKINTIRQRKALYEKILMMFNEDENYCQFLCCISSELTEKNIVKNPELLPELNAQKPKYSCGDYVWWRSSDRLPRIKALRNAIKLCDKDIMKN